LQPSQLKGQLERERTTRRVPRSLSSPLSCRFSVHPLALTWVSFRVVRSPPLCSDSDPCLGKVANSLYRISPLPPCRYVLASPSPPPPLRCGHHRLCRRIMPSPPPPPLHRQHRQSRRVAPAFSVGSRCKLRCCICDHHHRCRIVDTKSRNVLDSSEAATIASKMLFPSQPKATR